jgi:hypothetical protein
MAALVLATWILETWVRIPLETWMSVAVCVVLSCVATGLAAG